MNIFMRFPNGKAKALTLSYDDGVIQDKKLIEILKPYGIKATFNINSGQIADKNATLRGRMSLNQILETYCNTEHEIAVHGLTHPFLEKLSLPVALNDIIEDRRNLERIFGRIIRGMAYPYGTYSEKLIEGLKSIGIVYSRTTISTQDFRLPSEWLKLTATCHHNNPNLLDLIEKFLKSSPEKELKNRDSLLFYLWGHSYEFDDNNNWHIIEKFAQQIGNREDIWYATNIEIYDYTKAFDSLIFSVSGNLVLNPSNLTVWFEKNGRITFRAETKFPLRTTAR